ncbi:MAG: thioredoxin [candidate division KSB1 bacterium]|nr:thioredoxin [candidate division KSB1 bacterium]MDZ7273779.1 thioredoxin [candidate division KSB1 bacterium]MDZ7285935.1 thioredoxin [candidate division KSB1 bacterium]MDZ7298967.1 thioredoxin [candidate division KSB1 bacterium]MDZ7308594.1 thioredoxin [candidate division KSB1 bacterium]
MSHPVVLSDSTFEKEVLQSNIPVLVDFWAEWCGPCKMIAPAINELAGEYAGRVKIAKLDVDSNQIITSQYGIRSIPTLLIFKNGRVVDQIVGALPKQRIKERLDATL